MGRDEVTADGLTSTARLPPAAAGVPPGRIRETLARAARPEASEIEDLVSLASSVNLGATRPNVDQIAAHCKTSAWTTAGLVPWDQGLLFLVTDLTDDNGNTEIGGSCKLQFALDACWERRNHSRVTRKGQVSSFTVLRYSDEKHGGLEMAGNVVRPDLRGHGLGRFHVQARLLFSSIYPPPKINHLFANLLTTDNDGRYPFFEEIVRPLLGDVEYDQADHLRYTEPDAIRAFLGATESGAEVEILFHAMPREIREQFGAVRAITRRVQRVFERYGFQRGNRFDLLDGGQYYELPLSRLQRLPAFRDLLCRPVRGEIQNSSGITFASRERGQGDYFCVRAQGSVDESTLELHMDAALADRLGLRAGEAVRAILD